MITSGKIFSGRYLAAVDGRWRLTIPSAIKGQFSNQAYLGLDQNLCIMVFTSIDGLSRKKANSLWPVQVRTTPKQNKTSRQTKRILIPPPFRNSVSFQLGKKVLMVGVGKYFELQPYK